MVHRLCTGLSTTATWRLISLLFILKENTLLNKVRENREEGFKRNMYFQLKLGFFTSELITVLFINSNLIPPKFGDYLNTANSHGIFLEVQLDPPFPKEQDKGKEAQDTSEN